MVNEVELCRTDLLQDPSPLLTTLLGLYDQYGIQIWDSSSLVSMDSPNSHVVTMQCDYETPEVMRMIWNTGPWKSVIEETLQKTCVPFSHKDEHTLEIQCQSSWIHV